MQPCVPYSNYHDGQTKREEAPVLHTHQGPIGVEFHLILRQPRAIRFRLALGQIHRSAILQISFLKEFIDIKHKSLNCLFSFNWPKLFFFSLPICEDILPLLCSRLLSHYVSTWNREDMEIHILIDYHPDGISDVFPRKFNNLPYLGGFFSVSPCRKTTSTRKHVYMRISRLTTCFNAL